MRSTVVAVLSVALMGSLAAAGSVAAAELAGDWSGTCAEEAEPHATSEMRIGFSEAPRLTLSVWGLTLPSGQGMRVAGKKAAIFLFTERGGEPATLEVRFEQNAAPGLRWQFQKRGDGLLVTTTKVQGSRVIAGTRWQCQLARG